MRHGHEDEGGGRREAQLAERAVLVGCFDGLGRRGRRHEVLEGVGGGVQIGVRGGEQRAEVRGQRGGRGEGRAVRGAVEEADAEVGLGGGGAAGVVRWRRGGSGGWVGGVRFFVCEPFGAAFDFVGFDLGHYTLAFSLCFNLTLSLLFNPV